MMQRFQIIFNEVCFELVDVFTNSCILATTNYSHACDYYEGLIGEFS